jgi:hypothetical protein
MDLNLFRQDIKRICLLIAFQQNLSSRPKNRRLLPFGKKSLPLHRRRFKSMFFAKGLKSKGERLKFKFWSSKMVKIGRVQHNYRRCRRRTQPSEVCNDENNSVSRSAMDALRNSKKNCLLAVAIIFLFTFFNFIFYFPSKTNTKQTQHTSSCGSQESIYKEKF